MAHQAHGRGHVTEASVAVIAVKDARLLLIRVGRAVAFLPFNSAEEIPLRRPFDVVAAEEVQISIEIVVEPAGAAAPLPRESVVAFRGPAHYSRLFRDV